MARPRIACVVGTRPDAIKSAPLVLELLRCTDRVETVLVATGQHRELLRQALNVFGLKPDFDLSVMQQGQSLSGLTSRAVERLDAALAEVKPDMVLAQGDTTSTFVASLVAYYRGVPFGHVEAGLRTETVWNPYPEEFNRRAAGLLAAHHYAPTQWAADNLRREGVPEDRLFVTGNTGIDAVMHVAENCQTRWFEGNERRVVLLTTHRRENWGEPQQRIASAILEILDEFPDVLVAVPMHPNPIVRTALEDRLGRHERVVLMEPPDYPDFVKLMQRSTLILTDSGGVQEEAPAFGVPVLVLRETTERPEGVEAGVAKLVGTDTGAIVSAASRLLGDPEAFARMAFAASPYGDGKAAARIRCALFRFLSVPSPEEAMWA